MFRGDDQLVANCAAGSKLREHLGAVSTEQANSTAVAPFIWQQELDRGCYQAPLTRLYSVLLVPREREKLTKGMALAVYVS